MSTKKAAKKAPAKTTAKATKPEAKQTKANKPSQASLIVELLKRKVEPAKIVDQVKAACGGSPTVGYVNWLGRKNNLLAVASPT